MPDTRKTVLAVCWCCIIAAVSGSVFAGGSTSLILKSANSNENRYNNGNFISVLRGNVVFIYDDITIYSDEATWWRSEGRIHFENNIRAEQKSQIITCDRMRFLKKENMLHAIGHFCYRDTAEFTEITGGRATYRIDTKDFSLKNKPRLVRFDTSAAETLTIIGKTMYYTDSIKQARVDENVVITKGKLRSACEQVFFNTETNKARLREKPEVEYGESTIVGDSIDLQFSKEALRSASIYGNAHGVYVDTGTGQKKDTAYTDVWGDSLFMSISDSTGNLDSLWVHGKALSKYYTARKRELVNQASGKVMLMSFGGTGDVDRVRIWGNARSTYHIEEDKSNGINEASGDSISVAFEKGKAVFLNLAGSARGIFFPRD